MNQSMPLHRRRSDSDATGTRDTVPGEPPGMTKLFVFTHPLVSTAILLVGSFLAAIVSG
jgi:hypothetical protein